MFDAYDWGYTGKHRVFDAAGWIGYLQAIWCEVCLLRQWRYVDVHYGDPVALCETCVP